MLDATGFRLLNAWQRDFPLEPRPFARIAADCGLDEDDVLARFAQLRSRGLIDRIAPVFRPNTVGASTLGFKERYETNEWWLMGAGDILLLHTDGLTEHSRGNEQYFPGRLEQTLRQVKDQSAKQILESIEHDLLAFNPPSACISWNLCPPASTSISTGGNAPGIDPAASRISLNSFSALSPPLAAIAPIFQATGRSASRLVVSTKRRRPRRCSAATSLNSSGVTRFAINSFSGQVSKKLSPLPPSSKMSAAVMVV